MISHDYFFCYKYFRYNKNNMSLDGCNSLAFVENIVYGLFFDEISYHFPMSIIFKDCLSTSKPFSRP